MGRLDPLEIILCSTWSRGFCRVFRAWFSPFAESERNHIMFEFNAIEKALILLATILGAVVGIIIIANPIIEFVLFVLSGVAWVALFIVMRRWIEEE
jgi:hypothetical protein